MVPRAITHRFVGIALTLAFSVVFASGALGQDQSTLRVLVLSEEDGSPVVGANTVLFYAGGEERGRNRYVGVTNDRGLQEFGEVRPGPYRLVISHVSHQTYRDTLTLHRDQRQLERVSLAMRTQRIEEVVVRDERDVTTGEAGVRRISQEDINRIPSPAPSGDLASYLRTLPSVEMTGSRGGNLYVRGGTPTQNQVLIDNVPVVKPFHILNIFSPVPSSVVQNIDLYAGGFGAQYLGKTSSVIDIRLRPGNMKQYIGEAAVSPYLSTVRAEGPVVKNEQSFLFVGRKSLISQSSAYLPEESPSVDFYDLTARYSLLSENYSCNATTIHSNDEGKIDPGWENRMSWSNTAVGVSCLGFSPEFENRFEVTLGYSRYSNAEYKGAERVRHARFGEGRLSVDLRNSGVNRQVEYGFEVRIPQFRARLDETFSTLKQLDQRSAIFETYVSFQWRPSPRLRVQPSLGAQVPIVDVQPTIEPRLRISSFPFGADNHEISLAAGRYSQLSWGFSDTRDVGHVFNVLKPYKGDNARQSALHGILGYEGTYFRMFDVSVEGYLKRHRDVLVAEWTPDISGSLQTGQADGLSYGVDTRLEFRRDDLYLFLSYGWSRVTYEAAAGDLGAWIQEPVFEYTPAHDRRHKLTLTANYEIGAYDASLHWSYGSGRPYTKIYGYDFSLDVPHDQPTEDPGLAKIFFSRPYGGRLPAYHRLDVSAARTFEFEAGWALDVQAGVLNLYDRENIFFLNPETLRRTDQMRLTPYVSVGLTVK